MRVFPLPHGGAPAQDGTLLLAPLTSPTSTRNGKLCQASCQQSRTHPQHLLRAWQCRAPPCGCRAALAKTLGFTMESLNQTLTACRGSPRVGPRLRRKGTSTSLRAPLASPTSTRSDGSPRRPRTARCVTSTSTTRARHSPTCLARQHRADGLHVFCYHCLSCP